MNGTLFVVATPIGNLEDIALRAIKILKSVDAIACEDTRKTGMLMKHLSLSDPNMQEDYAKTRLISYYEQNEAHRIPEIINSLKNGLNIALVSDAGTPTISDPGFKLVRECIREGITVESIPGPSSVISSLVSSGLPTDKFLFIGYLPKKEGKKIKLLNEFKCFKTLKQIHPTIIFFESPYRLLKTLGNMKEIFGDIDIVICRELTKVYEEIRREKISNSIEHFSKTNPKGEFVILFNFF
ncbi:MAG: 16S rRNA (cytidine(1402)-2'-O)-methyltransferase [Candidatus Levybacteria bacterium]|nr:16S rRNA (cytidine(1402)-2'-O)-methyltransferase [Candidatus Levybacteria bacterium]